MVDQTGQQLGNYRLIRLLGAGGFARVYLSEHIYLGTLAAVKVLDRHLTDEEVERFRNEARTIAHLEHPNIVRVLDFGIEDLVPYLIMSYAPNGSLYDHYHKDIPLPLERILPYVKQIAAALQYAHDNRVIHRDIKPHNMLLGNHNEVLLSDFGIAALAHTEASLTTQEMAGTAPYMAPEQIRGKPRPSSDQYALGIVVYEWLCGVRPFRGSWWEIITQQISVPPPPLRDIIPNLPIAIEEVVLKALVKDPQERFASVQDFAEALEHASQGVEPPNLVSPATSSASLPLTETQPTSMSTDSPAPLPPPPPQLAPHSQPNTLVEPEPGIPVYNQDDPSSFGKASVDSVQSSVTQPALPLPQSSTRPTTHLSRRKAMLLAGIVPLLLLIIGGSILIISFSVLRGGNAGALPPSAVTATAITDATATAQASEQTLTASANNATITATAQGAQNAATLAQFNGNWVNDDSGQTKGVSRLNITSNGTTISVQAFGKCGASDCLWGTQTTPFTSPQIIVNYTLNTGGLESLTISLNNPQQLKVVDISTTNGSATYTFHKS